MHVGYINNHFQINSERYALEVFKMILKPTVLNSKFSFIKNLGLYIKVFQWQMVTFSVVMWYVACNTVICSQVQKCQRLWSQIRQGTGSMPRSKCYFFCNSRMLFLTAGSSLKHPDVSRGTSVLLPLQSLWDGPKWQIETVQAWCFFLTVFSASSSHRMGKAVLKPASMCQTDGDTAGR